MKVAFFTNRDNNYYEAEKIIAALNKYQLNFDIINPLDLNIEEPKQAQQSIKQLEEYDLILSRIINQEGKLNSFKIRNFFIQNSKKIRRSWLNGQSYFKWPVCSKIDQAQAFKQNQISTPKTEINQPPNLDYPFVLKGAVGSRGLAVHLINNEQEFKQTKDNYAQYITQEYLPTREDYRVYLLEGRVLGMMKKQAAPGKFVTNIHEGGIASPVEEQRYPELAQLAKQAAQAVACQLAGVDIMYHPNGQALVLEVNRAPGFRGLESVNQVNVSEETLKTLLHL